MRILILPPADVRSRAIHQWVFSSAVLILSDVINTAKPFTIKGAMQFQCALGN